jgi:hypothetical protein
MLVETRGGIARMRKLVKSLPEGEEIEVARERVDAALCAVVDERAGRVLADSLRRSIARTLVGELGLPWSGEQRRRATALEVAAHGAVQDLWLLVHLEGVQ